MYRFTFSGCRSGTSHAQAQSFRMLCIELVRSSSASHSGCTYLPVHPSDENSWGIDFLPLQSSKTAGTK